MVAREKCSRRVVALLTVLAITVVLMLLFILGSKASVSASTTDFKGGSAVGEVSESLVPEISVFQTDIVAPY